MSLAQQMHKPIAPRIAVKEESDCVSSSTIITPPSTSMKCRRKITFHPTLGYAIPTPQPAKVARRNARERNRVKQVNSGFSVLRSHIPSAAKQKKMSKVEILRHAAEYIQNLQRMLINREQQHPQSPRQQSKEKMMSPTPSSTDFALLPPQIVTTPTSNQATATPYSDQCFQYPSPLTPATPNTATCHFNSNESGYDTSSYHSNTSGYISPNPCQPATSHYSPNSTSPLDGSQSQQYAVDDHYASNSVTFYDNAEEDELLDVIAKWQEQDN